ncbi:carbamoyltransferase HypF [Curvibacter sp. HBC61]|uniref:Carbamoyltransferase HypF n=1 Tax=Curvibacter cyanobacteriorum TaxID=3026422 RepID=A0ABT5N0R3_9BURK|nr:carbamoyltransferase HypF [Curvibacter sp. HBC61]MDD0839106.1 carbamoyltransferase HypF [Curvibacter sp. HBC61]
MTSSVLAVGAWLKNAACLVLEGRAHWSPVHGDLSDPAACEALEASVRALLHRAAAKGRPVQAIAHDLHPDFFSTRLAIALAHELGVPAVGVQHHHAHLGAVVAEHGLEGPVVGLALDGIGLGSDGGLWGGELLWLDGPRWQRLGHLLPLALPGGDRAAREPWRMAASALHAADRADQIVPRFGGPVGEPVAAGVRQMLDRRVNCPLTSSTGRWFDAAAAALGLCLRQQDEAQAAIALEQAAARALARHPALPPLPGAVVDDAGRLDLRPLLMPLFDTARAASADADAHAADAAAAGFHLGLADALGSWLSDAARRHRTHTVVLGGGCFFNRILRERLVRQLSLAGLSVHLPGPHGCGDAGLALGQAWVTAQQCQTPPAHHPVEEAFLCA